MAKEIKKESLLKFYEECFKNGFTDFNDEYQNYKIKLIAKKYEIDEITDELFEEARNESLEKTKKEAEELSKKIKDELKNKTEQINQTIKNTNEGLVRLNGKEKRIKQIKDRIEELQKEIKNLDKDRDSVVNAYYAGNRESHDSWFVKGLGTELATGSRALGSLAVAEVNEKNRQIDERNAILKSRITEQVYSNPKFSTAKQRREIEELKKKLDKYEMAFVSENKSFIRCIGYDDLKWDIDDFFNAITVRANVWQKEMPKMPNNINASIDGTCQAIIYRKSDNATIASALMPLPFMGTGLGGRREILGIVTDSGIKKDEINEDEYGIILTDYNTCAIEESDQFIPIPTFKSDDKPEEQDRFFYDYLKEHCDFDNLEKIKITKSKIESIGTHIDGKESFIASLDARIIEIENQKEELRRQRELKNIEDRKKAKPAMLTFAVAFVLIIIFGVLYFNIIMPRNNYNNAMKAFNEGNFDKALSLFSSLNQYKDSEEMKIESKYYRAKQLLDDGQYDEAIINFEELADYKDSCNLLKEAFYGKATVLFSQNELNEAIDILKNLDYPDKDKIYKKALSAIIKDTNIKEKVYFGKYESDGDFDNGPEEISWILLEKRGDKALLFSEYGLDVVYYGNDTSKETWETSHIRNWLNNDFYNNAFSENERELVSITRVVPESLQTNQLDAYTLIEREDMRNIIGNETDDKVFVLSYKETQKYYGTDYQDNSRGCSVTRYARHIDPNGSPSCWLRNSMQGVANRVQDDGIMEYYSLVDSKKIVRPALWIDISD